MVGKGECQGDGDVRVKENVLCGKRTREKEGEREGSQVENALPGVMRAFRDWWGPLLGLQFDMCYTCDAPFSP